MANVTITISRFEVENAYNGGGISSEWTIYFINFSELRGFRNSEKHECS